MVIIISVSYFLYFYALFLIVFLSTNSLVKRMAYITNRSDTRMIKLLWPRSLYRLHVLIALHYRLALPYTEVLHLFVELN